MTSLEPGYSLKDGDYIIQGELGTGTFGTTYQATRQLHDGQEEIVAIKIGKDELPDNQRSEREQKFKDEAKRLKQFNHKHIVKFIEYFYDQTINRPCLVMEYIEGKTLETLTQPESGLPEEQAINYIKQVADALAAMHEVNLIHRDVNHRNIMVRHGTEEAILIDFGIAREFVPDRTIELTQQWSEYYAPPEQQQRRLRAGPRVDIYALSATFYFLLTGQKPVSSRDRESEIKIYKRDPQKQDTEKFVSNLALRRAILKGMELNPKRRSHSISDWLNLLEPSQERNRTEISRWVIGVIFGLVLLAAVAIPLINNLFDSDNQSNSDNPPPDTTPSSTEWEELEAKAFSAIDQLRANKDSKKAREVLNLFEQNKNKYKQDPKFYIQFSELTRFYAEDLAGKSSGGVEKAITKLEEIELMLEYNFEIESLPENHPITKEYTQVTKRLNKMKKSLKENN
ncbi:MULTISPECIES: serine/threonine-protein kinase [unclassified Moorena]|uniref:serine/threonine protein kinase n=1 Tax=unclassified Moorena TaxID=2683338 RepID=UPI0013FF5605|nr:MULTISPECIES: serine/threonine-protein kinase [unclassified Moorena]NEO13884.1 serine/threonine protein kinase [Moorena sp. SIO3E8]NEQ00303.1 serine/threonine protein kinase [Moorena sp. SIO3F7]